MLAVETKLGYQRFSTQDGLIPALTDRILARPAEVATDLRWIPALIALLCLVAAYLPRRSRCRHELSEHHAALRTS